MDEEENLTLGEMPEGTVLNNSTPIGGRIGLTANMGAMQPQQGDLVSQLPGVADPDKAFAGITRQEYIDYITNYRDFEEDLIERATTDTSLIDQAREDAPMAAQLSADIAARNRQRYGTTLTPAQMQAMQGSLQRASTLGGIQAVEDAKISQREANQRLLSDLINIGQGVNRASQSQMGQAAADASARRRAYEQARSASKAQTMATVGSLASTAILVKAGI